MNRLREILARRIERNGGYSTRWNRYALEWTVSFIPDLSLEHIHSICEDKRPVPDEIAEGWDEQQMWDLTQDIVARNLVDGDDCAFSQPTVQAATRWGFAYYRPMAPISRRYKRRAAEMCYYPAGLKDWIKVDPYTVLGVDVKFELEGRGGKHVVISEFEGLKLTMRSDDLAEAIRDNDDGNGYYSNTWCRKLLMMLDVWDEVLTGEAAESEGEYQAASMLEQEMDEWYTENAERQFWAERDVVTEA